MNQKYKPSKLTRQDPSQRSQSYTLKKNVKKRNFLKNIKPNDYPQTKVEISV